jgi:phage-related protein
VTAPGAQYLPPIVTQLLGDASDLLAKLSEATAAEKAYAASASDMADKVKASSRGAGRDVDEFTDLVVRKMHAGESAAQVLKRRLREVGDEVATLRKRISVEGANQGLYSEFRRANDELKKMRNLAREIAPELLAGARTLGQRFGIEFAGAFSGIGELLMPILIGALVLASPAIAGVIGGAVAVGLGLGFAGLGAFLAAMFNSKVKRIFGEIGKAFKNIVGKAVTGSFDDALIRGLQAFKTYIPSIGKSLRSIFDTLAPVVERLADVVGGGLTDFFAALAAGMPDLVPALEAFMDTIPMVMQAVAQFLIAISDNGPALARFIADAANAIVVFLDGAGKVIGWLEDVYLWFAKLNDKFPILDWQRHLIGLQITIKAVRDFFVNLWHSIVDIAKDVGNWFADLGKSIWAFLSDAGGAVADWFDDTVQWFQELPGRVVGFLASMPGRVQAVFSDMAHRAAYWVGWLVGRWFTFITEAPGKIVSLVAQAWGWVVAKFQEGVAATIAKIQAFPAQVASFFAALYASAVTWVKNTWAAVSGWFTRTRDDMRDRIRSGIDAVITFFKGLPGRASEQAKSFKDRIVGFFKGAREWLVDAGKNIVRGIIDGVKSMWNWAVDQVKSFARDILHGFKDALGISSPAKAFVGPGAMSALGYVKGWRDTMRKARSAFDGPSTRDIVFSAPVGTPRPVGSGGGYDPRGGDAPMMVHATFAVDGRAFVDATTPASQRRGARNGITGTGVPTTRIM